MPATDWRIQDSRWHGIGLTDLTDDQRIHGVVAFSSGNHAQGVAWAARRLDVPATIIMPEDAPAAKSNAVRNYGATIIGYDRRTESREKLAAQLAEKTGAVVVPSFDDPWIIEGQGSAGVEIAAQMASQCGLSPSHIIVCCGGGGLSAGLALALAETRMTIVEPDGWDDMGHSLRSGRIIGVADDAPATLCDALQTPLVSSLTFDVLKKADAQAVSVRDDEVLCAMRLAFERLRLVLEPGGAAALAAVLAGKVAVDDRSVVMLTGGNVDPETFVKVFGF
jgi:threonine dehydratase